MGFSYKNHSIDFTDREMNVVGLKLERLLCVSSDAIKIGTVMPRLKFSLMEARDNYVSSGIFDLDGEFIFSVWIVAGTFRNNFG